VWQPIAARALLVLVGVTGVGKSTTLAALQRAGLAYHSLPDRRDLTDRLIIPTMLAVSGAPLGPVTDRTQRFALTRVYREHHPGGMGAALSTLLVDVTQTPGLLLFDGLRGENEVTHAARLLPRARFVVLDAPDAARVIRLMDRQDPFDVIAARADAHAVHELQRFVALRVEGAEALFTPQEQHILADLVSTGEATADDLRKALTIVVEERRNYDPTTTRAALVATAPARTLIVDTVADAPQSIALKILDFLRTT
jgi:energy-coupling factor transporter ATP-binding protein EcfA2